MRLAEDDFTLLVHWPHRQEDRQGVARRLTDSLRVLGNHDPIFAQWFTTSSDGPENCERVEVSAEAVARRLGSSQFGLGCGLWTGDPERAAAVLLDADSRANQSRTLTVEFPQATSFNDPIFATERLARTLLALGEIWDADWGAVKSNAHEKRRDLDIGRGYAAWLTLVDASRIDESFPVAARSSRRAVVAATLGPFDVDEPSHVESVLRIEERLRAGGARLGDAPWYSPTSTSS